MTCLWALTGMASDTNTGPPSPVLLFTGYSGGGTSDASTDPGASTASGASAASVAGAAAPDASAVLR